MSTQERLIMRRDKHLEIEQLRFVLFRKAINNIHHIPAGVQIDFSNTTNVVTGISML